MKLAASNRALGVPVSNHAMPRPMRTTWSRPSARYSWLERRDLEFASIGGCEFGCLFGDTGRVHVEARHRPIGSRRLRFLLESNRSVVGVELNDAVLGRVRHLVAEYDCVVVLTGQSLPQEVQPAVDEVVTEDEDGPTVIDESGANDEGLGDSPRMGLLRVLQTNAEL